MTRTEFIAGLRAMADDLESGTFHLAEIGKHTVFCNRNYGQIWIHVAEGCTLSFDLYSATEEEKTQSDGE